MIHRPIINELKAFESFSPDLVPKILIWILFSSFQVFTFYFKFDGGNLTLGLAIFLLITPIVKPLVGSLLDAPLSTYEDYKLNPEKYRKSQLFLDPIFEITPILYMYFIFFFFVYLVDESFFANHWLNSGYL